MYATPVKSWKNYLAFSNGLEHLLSGESWDHLHTLDMGMAWLEEWIMHISCVALAGKISNNASMVLKFLDNGGCINGEHYTFFTFIFYFYSSVYWRHYYQTVWSSLHLPSNELQVHFSISLSVGY